MSNINNGYSIYADFDIEQHKQTYTNYLEVLIDPDGRIVYAIPSHKEKATALACAKLGVTRRELEEMCPREYYGDYLNWLLQISGSISVWNDFCVAPTVTKKQVASLRKLKLAGIYRGAIPALQKAPQEGRNGRGQTNTPAALDEQIDAAKARSDHFSNLSTLTNIKEVHSL